jgi:hypothetical protein
MGEARRKRARAAGLAEKLAGTLSDTQLAELMVAGLVTDTFAAESQRPERRRELYPREAAALLCECRHLAITGLWDSAPHQRILQVLIGQYGTNFPFAVCHNAYAPSEPRTSIGVLNANTQPSFPAGTERVYPPIFNGFLPDTPKHRESISAVVTITALQFGIPVPHLNLGESNISGPILGLTDDAEFSTAMALLCNGLRDIYHGQGDDRSLN